MLMDFLNGYPGSRKGTCKGPRKVSRVSALSYCFILSTTISSNISLIASLHLLRRDSTQQQETQPAGEPWWTCSMEIRVQDPVDHVYGLA